MNSLKKTFLLPGHVDLTNGSNYNRKPQRNGKISKCSQNTHFYFWVFYTYYLRGFPVLVNKSLYCKEFFCLYFVFQFLNIFYLHPKAEKLFGSCPTENRKSNNVNLSFVIYPRTGLVGVHPLEAPLIAKGRGLCLWEGGVI